jgi:DNA-binding CsgD family transcriptional regulator/ArsR family metal-binding transcriptional regulator
MKQPFNNISNIYVSKSGVNHLCPAPNWGLSFNFDNDATHVMPLINSIFPKAEFFGSPPRIKFSYKDILCNLYANEVVATPFSSRELAYEFSSIFLEYLNEVQSNKNNIKPNHKTKEQLSALDIYKLLPQSNCKICNFPSCFAFACALSKQQAIQSQCPNFISPISTKAVYPLYDSKGKLSSTIALDINNSAPTCQLQHSPKSSLQHTLSSREIEVISLLAHGSTNKQISAELFISPHTVKSHIVNIFSKLGVRDRAQAAVWAAKHNVV